MLCECAFSQHCSRGNIFIAESIKYMTKGLIQSESRSGKEIWAESKPSTKINARFPYDSDIYGNLSIYGNLHLQLQKKHITHFILQASIVNLSSEQIHQSDIWVLHTKVIVCTLFVQHQEETEHTLILHFWGNNRFKAFIYVKNLSGEPTFRACFAKK